MPVNVLTAPISVSDPVGLTGAVVPLVQPTQPPATPIQLADIVPHAAPLQTQPVMIPQHTIVQQQQIGMDPQTSTIQQQPQQQMEAQVALLDQRLTATQPPMEKQPQGLSATALLTHPTEPQQQIFAQQSVPAVHSLPEQKLFPAATGMEQPAMSLPLEQHQAYRSQPTAENYEQMAMMQPQQLHHTPQQQQALLQQHQASLYVKQQLDQQQQQQQQAFLQAQLQQHQLDQQQALIQNKLLDQQQQQQILIQQQEQKQHQQVYLQPKSEQQQQELPRQQQQQPQSQLYQQCGQNLVGIQTDSEKPQQQQPGSQQQTHQTQQQQGLQQQQVLMQQLQQHQLQQLQQQEQHQAQLKQQMEQQQQALLQQQLEHQKQLMFQQQQAERLQQQALLQQQIQEQQQATVIHPQQSEAGDASAFPQSKSEQQIQQQFIEMQHPYIPQPNSSQFPIRATLSQQQGVGDQQHAAFIQKQQGFVGQPQLQPSSTDAHIPVGAPPNTEVAQQKQIVSQAHVAMAIQTPQIPIQTPAVGPTQVLTQQGQNVAFPQGQIAAHFIAQPAVHTPSATIESQVSLQGSVQGQAPTIQTQQISLQTTYPGTVAPTQNQVTAQELIQNQPLLWTLGQSQSQTGVQPPAAISSTHSQIQHETCAQQNLQTSGLIQPHLHQQAFESSVLQLQSAAAAHFTPQYVPQPTHSAAPSVTDKSYIAQPQQESVQQYQQMPPVSAGIVAPTTELSPPVTDPNIVTTQQARQTSTPGQAPVCPVTQVEQKSTGSAADPSVIEAVPQPAGQYKELQKLAQVQQPLAPSCPQPQLLSRYISTPTQQLHPPNQAIAAAPHQVTYPTAKAVPNSVAGPQSQDRSQPFYSDSAAGVPSSPQHQPKQMLPAHTHTQTSIQSQTHSQTQTHIHTQAHSHTQTHTETPASDQPAVPLAVLPASQMPLSPTHTSCPPTSLPLLLPSLPPYPPAAEPLTELPTSPPAAQVASPELADFIPTSPTPITTLHSLDSNAPKLPQASLQDCDAPLLGTAQVQEAGQFSLFIFLIILYINNTGIQLFGFLIHINKCNS